MEERRDQSVSAARDEAKQRASSAADDARRVAAEQGDAWRHSLLSTIDHVAEAMDAAASSLREDEPRLAGAVEDLSQHVKHFAGDGHNKSFDELRGDLEQVARRNPTLFMAGAMALGLGLSRVLKSTPPEHRDGGTARHRGSAAGAGAAPPPGTSRNTTTPPRPGASTTPAGQPDRPSAASGASTPPRPSPSPSPAQSPAAVPGSAAPKTGRSI